jgi:iron(III) transport system ATP-binding protein
MAIMELDGSLCQFGNDEDIILRPANRFTFEFIGVSNMIPVKLKDKKVHLDCGIDTVLDVEVPKDADFSVKTDMGVRMNDVVFDDKSPVKAKVESKVFLGSEYNYFLRLGDRQIRVQQSMLDAKLGGVPEDGAEVGIRFVNPRFYPAKEVSGEAV